MKAKNSIFILMVLALAATSVALWGCGKSSSSSGGGSADDDSGGSVEAACNAYVDKCGVSALEGQSCSYFELSAITDCLQTAALNFFSCLTAADCTATSAIETCTQTFTTAAEGCV